MSSGDAAGAGAVSTTVATSHRARRDCPRPDRWTLYPDPRLNFRPTMFGLSLDAYRAEVARCRDARWQAWELDTRFPRPESVAA